jgi:hypothetical protein
MPPLISRRLLFDDADRSWARISPDGRRVAFLAPLGGVLNLWVAPLTDVAKARPVTHVTDRSLSSWFVWLHDSRRVVVFREQGGDENWQAHGVDVDTEEIRALSPGPGVRSYVQETSARFPSELLIAHNQRDSRYFDIYRVNAVTGESVLIEKNDGFRFHLTDTNLRVRLAVRYADDGGVEYLQRDRDGEWQPFARVEMADAMATRAVDFSDDGRELYWLDARGRDTAAVVAQDMATGTTRVLAEDGQTDFVQSLLEPVSRRPVAAMSAFTRRRWRVLDPAYAAD